MKTKIVLHDVYPYCDVTYPVYLLVRNRYYKNPTSFKCFKIMVFWDLFIMYILQNAVEQRHPEDWSWKNVNSQHTLLLDTIFSYGKEYMDWTEQEQSHITRKQEGFLHIWPFNLFAQLIKWNSTLCHAFFLKNRISRIRRFLHYLYWASVCRCAVRF